MEVEAIKSFSDGCIKMTFLYCFIIYDIFSFTS